jgi:peptidoglycan/xylan/chitin deacetylase (PgdA/CDA1 family)
MTIGRRRWIVKKLARRGAALSAHLPPVRSRTQRVRVLTYHRFASRTRDPFAVAPALFADQMRWLADRGLAISLDQLRSFVAGHASLPLDAVLVTIDDGFACTHDVALPILRDHGVPAVAFITTSLVGRRLPEEPERYMTWEELAAVADGGVDIGSHAWHHRSLARVSADAVREEGARSRAALTERLGVSVDAFAYPFGTRGDYDAMTEQVLGEIGYTTLFTSQHGAIRPGMNPRSLPRIKVEGGEDLALFAAICRGGLDAWRFVDQALWRLQRLRREQG